MNFFPDVCVAAEFVGLMLLVTIKLDTARGKAPNLPRTASVLARYLIVWPIIGLAAWALLLVLGV